jgi:hypothetical protein
MKHKITPSQAAERLLYIFAVVLIPNIPLFFQYNQNAAQGILFRHCLIFSGALALLSLLIYLLVSGLALRRRRTLIVVTLFWAAFWFFHPLHRLVSCGNAGYPLWKTAVYAVVIIAVIGFVLRGLKMSRLVSQTVAVVLCLLFAFNLVPGALSVYRSEKQRVANEAANTKPYEIKTEFSIDPGLPHPNIYWLHMDGMIGFDAVEKYFNDSQTELKAELADRGFAVNVGARLEAGYTRIAIPALTSPVFYDSYLADEFVRVAQFTRGHRENSLAFSMAEKGFSLDDIYPKLEVLKAFSDAGYINITNYIGESENIYIWNDGSNATIGIQEIRAANIDFNKIDNFKNLIVDASALTTVKTAIDAYFEKRRSSVDNSQPIPEYWETVDRYVTGDSDSNNSMTRVVKAMKYATAVDPPHFFYFNNAIMHVAIFDRTIGEVTYDEPVGATFCLDENGNYYDEPLEDPLDVHLYYQQHKYSVKQMMAQVYIILENDPDAVIVIQADHGIHGYGIKHSWYDYEALEKRGYGLQDQLNLNLQVISAVRIPEKYGRLTGPLHPLDITRYLVNHYVGQNYDYLYYKEED